MSLFRKSIAAAVARLAGVEAAAVLPMIMRSKSADFGISVARLLPREPKPSTRKGEGRPQGGSARTADMPAVTAAWQTELAAGMDRGLFDSVDAANNQLLFTVNPHALAASVLRLPTAEQPNPRSPRQDSRCASTATTANPPVPVSALVGDNSNANVVIEFSSPNIAKPFHAGHLRSTIIGGYLARLYTHMGYTVTRINYLGDWGKQFGLLGVGFELFGDRNLLDADPIRHLFDVYVKTNRAAEADPTLHHRAREYFRALETGGDGPERALWSQFRELSIKSYQTTYDRLRVEFDWNAGESMYGDAALAVCEALRSQGLTVTEDNGAELVDLSDHKLGRAILTKADGTTVYLSRDVAAANDRMAKLDFNKMIYVAGATQDLHFRQLFKTLDLCGHIWAKNCTHVNFGNVNGMSTRRGNVIFLDDILNEARDRMLEILERNPEKSAEIADLVRTAEVVGMSAVIVQDLKSRRVKNYEFDWERILKPEGDTGPFIQYTHARLCSIERVAGVAATTDCDLHQLPEPEAQRLITLLSMKDETLEYSLRQHEPSVLVQYLFQLCRQTSKALAVLRVKDSPVAVAEPRMLLFMVARDAIAEGLKLLGLEPLDRI